MSDLIWVSNRNMPLGEYQARKGRPVPEKVLAAIPELRFNALVRVGHLRQVEKGSLGKLCPECGDGPFTRLARHTTAMHEAPPEEVLELEAVGLSMSTDVSLLTTGGFEEE